MSNNNIVVISFEVIFNIETHAQYVIRFTNVF